MCIRDRGKVVVRCQTNLGRVVDEFNAECEGAEVEIGFNNRYLLDALRNARTEKVRIDVYKRQPFSSPMGVTASSLARVS